MTMNSRSTADGPRIEFASRRKVTDCGCAELKIEYSPHGEAFQAQSGSLEHWLTERYSLFAAREGGRSAYGQIDHPPWKLQRAEADFVVNSMLEPLGIVVPAESPLLHFSRSIDAVAWKLRW
jgi:uncharacterized protein YqjF (DUF2071 family)